MYRPITIHASASIRSYYCSAGGLRCHIRALSELRRVHVINIICFLQALEGGVFLGTLRATSPWRTSSTAFCRYPLLRRPSKSNDYSNHVQSDCARLRDM